MNDSVESISERFEKFNNDFLTICNKVGRDPKEVRVVTVTKGHTAEDIREVVLAGARIIGENYPEESLEKKNQLTDVASEVRWHMIGHLQSRKAKLVPEVYDCMESVDSLKIAKKLNGQFEKMGKVLPVMLQFNVGGEIQKYGWMADDQNEWGALLPEVSGILELKNLKVTGLMTMPPFTSTIEEARKYFSKLRELRDYLQTHFRNAEINELSMGTSHDYAAAIQEGATHIRIGTIIMGKRNYNI